MALHKLMIFLLLLSKSTIFHSYLWFTGGLKKFDLRSVSHAIRCIYVYLVRGFHVQFKHQPGPLTPLSRIWIRNYNLKLYCGYLYTRPCMINCIWGLKQLWLQVNGHAWFHLHEIHWAVRNRMGLKNSKWKYVSLAGFEPTHSAPRPVIQRLRTLGHAG